MNKFTAIFLILNSIILINCQTTTTTTTTTQDSTTTTQAQTTTTPKIVTTTPKLTTTGNSECGNILNATCSECIKNPDCFYCNTDNTCKHYKASGIFPEGCSAADARWISCSLNLQALIIGVAAGGTIILLIIFCCVCYCCSKTCKAVSDRNFRKVERKIARQREAITQRNQARKEERQTRNEAIRVKYGLKPSTYSTLEE